MAITTALCTVFKADILKGEHDFSAGGDVFKLALYEDTATLNQDTTAYSSSDEITGTGYVAGGGALTNVTPSVSGVVAIIDFADLSFTAASITARGALIYNSSNGNKAVMVQDFGSNKSVVGGDFTIIFPPADDSNAIIRIA